MKSRRLALANHLENPVANGRDFHLVVSGNSEILSFASPFYGVILADNNNSPSDNSDDLYGGYTGSFSATTAIILAVLISAFFVIVFFSICFRKCATEEENLRTSRRGGAGMDNGLVRMVDPGHRGLDRAVIESFPVFSYDILKGLKAQRKETHECAVCICEFEDDEQLRLLPKCSHAFHPECIDRWLFSHTTCPVCRISLVPTDEANPAGTGYGIIESPVITPPHDLGLVTMGASYRSASTGNDVEIPVAPSSTDSQESFAVVGHDQSEKFRRSYSTGHSLVRLRKDSDQLATEWYISTTEGLKPGHHRNCSLTAPSHSRSPGPSTSGTLPSLSKQASMSSTASHSRDTSGSGRRWYERGLRSERLNISSIYPTSLLRSFSVQRTPPYSGNQEPQEPSANSQQDRGKTYLQPLKRTLKRLTGREKEETDNSHSGRGSSRGVADNPHIERGSSSEVADNSQSGRGFSRAGAEENGSQV